MATGDSPLRVGVLLSGRGRGSNMAAILDACRSGRVRAEIVLVASTTPGTPAIRRAREAGIPTLELAAPPPGAGDGPDPELIRVFREAGVELVCLAGYMRLLSPEFLAAFPDRVLNIHPALLPAFGGKGCYGLRVHRAVLDAGVRFSGVTVHLVDEEYDHGPIVLQRVVPVLDDDTPESLAERVHTEELKVYPEAVGLFAEGRIRREGRRVRILPERSSA